MWCYVMFDLPVITKKERREATQFRNALLNLGFEMSQYSVYIKLCSGNEKVATLAIQVKKAFPHHGRVSILAVTEKQQENIIHLCGAEKKKMTQQSSQLRIF